MKGCSFWSLHYVIIDEVLGVHISQHEMWDLPLSLEPNALLVALMLLCL